MAPGDSSLLNFTIARSKKAGGTPSGVSAEDSRPGACRKLLQDPKLQRRKGRFLSARQFGRILDGNRQAGGWMVHAELKCRPGVTSFVTHPQRVDKKCRGAALSVLKTPENGGEPSVGTARAKYPASDAMDAFGQHQKETTK